MPIAIFVSVSKGTYLVTMYGSIFVVVYETIDVATEILIRNKRFRDIMKKCDMTTDDEIRTSIKRLFNGFKLTCGQDNKGNKYSFECIEHGISSYSKLPEEKNKGELYCIFEKQFDKGTDHGFVWDIYDTRFKLIRSNNMLKHEYHYMRRSSRVKCDKHGWWYDRKDEQDPMWMDHGNSKYGCIKTVSKDELIICKKKDVQRYLDFMKRVDYLLNM
jgi:hypothetical protein